MGAAAVFAPGLSGRRATAPVPASPRHREREGEAGAEADPAALGPDAPALGLDQALADGESQSAAGPAVAVPGGVFAEELAEALRRDAPSLVGNRDRDMHPVAFRRDPDRGGVRGVARGVGQEVVQHLHDALAVGQHRRQAVRQVDHDGVPGAAGEEGVARLLHQSADLRGLGRDRERAGFDAPGIEQVGDQPDHAVGLVVDDAEELARLGRCHEPRGAEGGGGRALDRGQRHAQLVAHHAEKLGAHPLQLLKGREVLHGDHHRRDGAVLGVDRGGVDQRGDAAPVGGGENDLLGAHRLGAAQHARERVLAEGDLAPVGETAGEDPEQVLGGAARHAQAVDDPPGLAVERDRVAGTNVEHDDADRRGLDQRLEVRAGAVLGAVGPRIGDRGRGLRGEQHQDLLVLVGERLLALLLDQVEIADMGAAVAHRRAQEGAERQQVPGKAERAHEAGEVRETERSRQVAQVLEEPAGRRATRPWPGARLR